MIEALLLLTGLVVGAVAALVAVRRQAAGRARPGAPDPVPVRGTQLSVRALDAALRIARFEQATLVPVYLVPVPMAMPLKSPIPRACGVAFELQEAIEQRASAAEIPVDARIVRGRTVRHALRELLAAERYDRLVVAAGTSHTDGLSPADVAWLLEHAPGEVAVVRPADESALAAVIVADRSKRNWTPQ